MSESILATKHPRLFSQGWGLGGPSSRWKFCLPLQPTAVPAFWPEPVPPTEFWILPNFSLNFDYFLAQNCTRKLYFVLKTPNLTVGGGGIFGLSGQFFQVPPSSDSVPAASPPIWLCPQRGLKVVHKSKFPPPPHQKFCEKTLHPDLIIIFVQ